MTVATFWYRRITEVGVLLSLSLLVVWALGTYTDAESVLAGVTVSEQAVIALGIAAIVSVAALLYQSHRHSNTVTVIVIASLAVAVLLSISSTGHMTSPYLPLWAVIGLFGAVAGLGSFLSASILLTAYGVYLALNEQLTSHDWLVYGMAVVLPLIIGSFIWHKRFQAQERSSQAVSALTHELSQESSKSSIIINAIADGVILIDEKGIIQLINPAAEQIIGWGSDEATKLDYRSVLKLVDKNNPVSAELDPVQQCLTSHESIITEKLGIRTVSGKLLSASIMVSPLAGNNAGVIVVFRDVTAQRAEEREQAEFISTASHEMRTPVAAIEGYLGLALNPQTAAIDEKARMYLGKAHESAQHLGRLFQDLLDISKVEDGRLNSKPQIIDVPGFVRGIVEDFKSQATEKGLSLIYQPDTTSQLAPLFYANVDRDHLHEILANLVSNAIKYTKEGTVTVDITGDDTHIFVSVQDSGLGIPPEDIPHLFQKFYRVDNSETREIGGTGLGLYLSRRLAESMDGRLSVTSTYGQGSTFTLDLPRVSKEDAQAAQAAQNQAVTKTANAAVTQTVQ